MTNKNHQVLYSIGDRNRGHAWYRLSAQLVGALLLISACGGDGGTVASSPATPSAPPATAPPPNRAPAAVGTIPEQVMRFGEDPVMLDVAQYFLDPDGDSLTYSATSGDTQVIAVSVSESTLTIAGAKPGQVTVSVSARDPQGATATQPVSVTVEGFTLSGTVSDSRTNGPVPTGAVVQLGHNPTQTVITDAEGRYRFLNVAGSVSVTVNADPNYLSQTLAVTIDADRTVDFALDHTGVPPFAGTVFVTPDILDASDPSSLGGVQYVGRRERQFWDRPAERWTTVNVHLFDVLYADHHVEYQVHPEFDSRQAAQAEVDKYAPALGRLPVDLLSGTREVEISVAPGFVFQGNGSLGIIHIYTDQGELDLRDGFVEEVLFHEGGHTSLDVNHADSVGWRAAQEADGVFISDYARDHPDSEDIAESILPYFAVRYHPERLTEADLAAILAAIPNRLAYFDEQRFDMSPYTVRGSASRHREMSAVQP